MAFVGEYRTKSGRGYCKWSFERQTNGEIRIYLLTSAKYGDRPADGHSTHLYRDEAGFPYICYEPMPRDLDDAIAVAKEWAERTEAYMFFGTKF